MRDNIDINIENLYDAYQKTLHAENTINDEKNKIYRFNELELPDKKIHAKGFNYNEELIRDDYVSSMNKLKKAYGQDGVGTVEKTRKHIYNLMGKLAETDERARAYFDDMQKQENSTIDAFGSDVDTTIQNVTEYVDNGETDAVNHTSNTNVNNVDSKAYNSGTEAAGHSGETNITNVSNTTDGPTKNSEAHTSDTNVYNSDTGYNAAPVTESGAVGSAEYPAFTDVINDSIFALPE
jgi:hypothetical protein